MWWVPISLSILAAALFGCDRAEPEAGIAFPVSEADRDSTAAAQGDLRPPTLAPAADLDPHEAELRIDVQQYLFTATQEMERVSREEAMVLQRYFREIDTPEDNAERMALACMSDLLARADVTPEAEAVFRESFREAFEHSGWRIRRVAMRCVNEAGWLRDPEFEPLVRAAVNDPNEHVRGTATIYVEDHRDETYKKDGPE